MKNRFYINEEDSHCGDFNYVITPDGNKIEYSYLCTQEEHFPPKNCGYRLAYETNNEDYRIIVDPFNMRQDEI